MNFRKISSSRRRARYIDNLSRKKFCQSLFPDKKHLNRQTII
jgi:hypothetical protein